MDAAPPTGAGQEARLSGGRESHLKPLREFENSPRMGRLEVCPKSPAIEPLRVQGGRLPGLRPRVIGILFGIRIRDSRSLKGADEKLPQNPSRRPTGRTCNGCVRRPFDSNQRLQMPGGRDSGRNSRRGGAGSSEVAVRSPDLAESRIQERISNARDRRPRGGHSPGPGSVPGFLRSPTCSANSSSQLLETQDPGPKTRRRQVGSVSRDARPVICFG